MILSIMGSEAPGLIRNPLICRAPYLSHDHLITKLSQSRFFCCQPGFCLSYGHKLLKRQEKGSCGLLGRSSIFLTRASIDDEFRSSRNIALSIHRRYKNVVDRGFSNNIKDFITAGVTAYAIGCTDEGLRGELLNMRDSDEHVLELDSGSGTGVKLKITSEEPTVVRWSNTSPVSDEAESVWRGFCDLIANAYYVRGMAWLPVKTLQLERMLVTGRTEEPSLVADRMRIVFATLENVSPQWPKG